MKKSQGAAAPLRVERRKLTEITPYARNARVHPPEQIAQIRASLVEFGWTYPMLVDGDNQLIAGHGRWTAACQIRDDGLRIPNWPDATEGPVIVADHLTAEQRRAYVIADNRIAEGARWDDELLKLELADLQELGVEASTIGFAAADLSELLGDAPTVGRHSNGGLAERFGIPPFTVLNAREGWWQDRKRAWLALGIRSELGRGAGAQPGGGGGVWGHRGPNDAYRNASPGGSPRPAMKLKGGRTVRGDGRGRPLRG